MESNLIVLGSFGILILISLTQASFRRAVRARRPGDWLLDGTGLLVQGVLIPVLQLTLLVTLLRYLLPDYQRTWNLHPAWGFFFNFVLLDWLFYWNHRLLHRPTFWKLHEVHHTAGEMDLIVTSRNSLWTSFFIVYFWVNGTLLFFLKEPSGLFLGAALTAALDIWTHSRLWSDRVPVLSRLVSLVFITPKDHAWHHSRNDFDCNFGATLKLWDRIHGTFHEYAGWPEHLGIDRENLTGIRALLYPLFQPRSRQAGEGEGRP